MTSSAIACFGPFRLLSRERRLLEGERPVRLGARATDLLIALVQNAGEVLSHKQLLARAWPHAVVEEACLRAQISALRKALGQRPSGQDFIANIPGRGYSFVASVNTAAAQGEPPSPGAQQNLPVRLSRTIGRADTIQAVLSLLAGRRLVTIVGPGGIGKTTAALAAAEQSLGRFADGVRFVDLSAVQDPGSVAASIAAAMGLNVDASAPIDSLVGQVRGLATLLVIDTCEHLVDAVAATAVQLLEGARDLRILATSREPLRVVGEAVHRLSALSTPPCHAASISAEQALRYPAVELLVERAGECLAGFELTDADAGVAAEICRRVDGNPLAIELAAARISFYGLRGLLGRLCDGLHVLSNGTRMTSPRHRTLCTLLDWSFDLLSPHGRAVLCRLSVFSGPFTLAAAAAVVSDNSLDPDAAADQVIDLALKSLVVAEPGGDAMRYRLAGTTRAYASEKLSSCEDAEQVLARYAHWQSAR